MLEEFEAMAADVASKDAAIAELYDRLTRGLAWGAEMIAVNKDAKVGTCLA